MSFIKRVIILLLATALQLKTQAQTRQGGEERVSIEVKNTNLAQVLKTIRGQVRTAIIFQVERVKTIPVNAFTAKDEPLGSVLDRLLSGTRLVFKYFPDLQEYILTLKEVKADVVVKGRVTDARGDEPLAGATIRVNGTSTTVTTDAGGNFTIAVPSEVSLLEISHVGYLTQMLTLNGSITYAVRLIASSKILTQVTVSARRRLNTEAALLNDRRTAAIVSDGISAANIEKTASITTAQALAKVTGVTITDDKYVAIRGLGDRAVIAELNGARLASSDPDRSSVPLDLVPAALLDNITVYKTMTPDKPADASAGIIELKTKSVPDSLLLSFTAATGFNTSVGWGGKFNAFQGYDPGFFGNKVNSHNLSSSFLNLSKEYPGGVAQINQMITDSKYSQALTAQALSIDRTMKSFNPVLTTSYQRASPNQLYAINFGNTFHIFHGHSLGVVAGLSYYNRTEDQHNSRLNQYSIYTGFITGSTNVFGGLHVPYYTTPNDVYFGKYLGYTESKGTQTLNYGGLLALTYKFNGRNEISGQYMGSSGAEITGTHLNGSFQNTGIDFPVYSEVYSLRQTYRTFRNFNLQGEHKLWDGYWAPHISWNGSVSRSTQNDPDFCFIDIADLSTIRYAGPLGAPIGSNTYTEVVGLVHGIGPGGVVEADPNGRRYRYLTEDDYNVKMDITFPTLIARRKVDFKIGGNYLDKERIYTENFLGFPGGGINNPRANTLLNAAKGDLNELIGYNNVGILNTGASDADGSLRQPGFIYRFQKSANNYTGYYRTKAGYLMADARLSPQWRLVGGVRFESTDIQARVDTNNVYHDPGLPQGNTTSSNNLNSATIFTPVTGLHVGYKPYYSGNLIYSLNPRMNFRLSYNTTLARPELRELTNIYEFDPFQFAVVVGNPNLKNQFTQSADFRWEWFTRPGEVFAASAFYKEITNQLTKIFMYNSQGTLATAPEFPITEFVNDQNKGHVYGVELEARKNLGQLTNVLNHFFFGSNLMLASSRITKNPDRLAADRQIYRQASPYSPLFEQAPYSLNLFLDYDNPRTRTNLTASFNIVGERLVQVQMDGTPDIYSRPAPQLDVIFSQHLLKRFQIRGFAKNLLNSDNEQVYTIPNNNGNFNGRHYTYSKFQRGTEYQLSLTYFLF
ncbi:MAG: carboxypeptidase-like regulatory domain-containing protein [Chitinophagaceae bacterium]|nr:carboxypeptidase-like regulatory domain-containing protein [Chitinophagaceae bacterium]